MSARQNEEYPMPSLQEQEKMLKKKYGGLLPKKPPLITQDQERTYFDSADWALEKQGEKPDKIPEGSEARPPKLQPTHQQAHPRRSPCAPADDDEGATGNEEPKQRVK